MTTNTTSQPSPKGNNSRQQLIAVAAVVIAALLAINAWLLYKYTQAHNAQTALTTQLDEATVLQEQLNEEYYQAKNDLDALRTDNTQLNALIDEKQTELDAAKERIAVLIRQGGNSQSARSEISKLKTQMEGYLAELNQLREQNTLLTDENRQLAQERDGLRSNLDEQVQTNQSLNQERALLVSEKEQLASNNNNLSRQVTQASAIKVGSLEANGQKLRRTGKPVTRRDAENVDQIVVTFNTSINEIAREGREMFYLRILNIQGETQAVEQMGSGVFTSATTGESMRYTLKNDIDYTYRETPVQFVWSPGQQFSAGKYTVEVYNKGYLVGTTTLVLK